MNRGQLGLAHSFKSWIIWQGLPYAYRQADGQTGVVRWMMLSIQCNLHGLTFLHPSKWSNVSWECMRGIFCAWRKVVLQDDETILLKCDIKRSYCNLSIDLDEEDIVLSWNEKRRLIISAVLLSFWHYAKRLCRATDPTNRQQTQLWSCINYFSYMPLQYWSLRYMREHCILICCPVSLEFQNSRFSFVYYTYTGKHQ